MKTKKIISLYVFFFMVIAVKAQIPIQIPIVGGNVSSCCGGELNIYYSLNEALAEPENVIILDLSMQSPKLTEVPVEVAQLKNLKCLKVPFNRVASIPQEITQLDSLECIDLSGNRYLAGIPEVLKELKSLKTVYLKAIPEWKKAKQEKEKAKFPNVEVVFE